MNTPKIVILAVAGALVVTLVVTATGRTPPPESSPPVNSPPVISLATTQPRTALAESGPGLVRIVATMPRSESDESTDVRSAPVLVDVAHLGPLAESEVAALMSSCERYRELRRRQFAERDVEATDSGDLLREAEMHYESALADCAIEAVANGSYVVLAQSEPAPLTLPGAEVLTTGTMRNGEAVNVCIVVTHDAYPRVREAKNYVGDMLYFDDSEKARRFNALPDDDRSALAARVRELRSKRNKTKVDREFLRATIGLRTRLVGAGNLLVAYGK